MSRNIFSFNEVLLLVSFQSLKEELNVLQSLSLEVKEILSKCDFLELSATEPGQSAEVVLYQELTSRFDVVVADVANLTDQLNKASAKREDLCVSFLWK